MVKTEVVDYIVKRAEFMLEQMEELGFDDDLKYDPTEDNIQEISDGEVCYQVVRSTANLEDPESIDSIKTVNVILNELNNIHKRRVQVKIANAIDGSKNPASLP